MCFELPLSSIVLLEKLFKFSHSSNSLFTIVGDFICLVLLVFLVSLVLLAERRVVILLDFSSLCLRSNLLKVSKYHGSLTGAAGDLRPSSESFDFTEFRLYFIPIGGPLVNSLLKLKSVYLFVFTPG